jgi:hypothetical protein
VLTRPSGNNIDGNIKGKSTEPMQETTDWITYILRAKINE